jgi:hypothetical protein
MFRLALVALLACQLAAFALPTPQNLTITREPGPGGNVALNWSPVSGATGYKVYRDVVPNVDLTFELTTVAGTTYSDPIAAGTKYFYAVTALAPVGQVSGTITDTSGVAFGGVLVWIVSTTDTSVKYFTYTLADGSYLISDVLEGTYSVCLYRYLRPVQYPANQVISDGITTTLNYQFASFAWTTVNGALAGITNWVNTNVYQLQGPVSVPSGSVLNIQEGTTIVGVRDTSGFGVALLEIEQGGQVMSIGSKYKPVVFTSGQPEGTRADGDWGGIIISGNAQDNRGLVAVGEGNTGPYGAADTLSNNDNSGAIVYTRLEFPGFRFTPTNELNGFCMQAVGRGTTISHVQVSRGQDDTFEFFGGSVNADHLVCSDGGDDHIDWTEGWIGHVQFVQIHVYAEFSDNGIEADNLEQDHNAVPNAEPYLANFTIFGKKGNAGGGGEGNEGIQVRRGTKAHMYNMIMTNARGQGFDLDDASTANRASSAPGVPNGNINLDYSIFWNNGAAATEVIDPSTGAGIGDGHFGVEDAENNVLAVNTIHIAAPVGWTQDISGFRGYSGFVGTNATNRAADPLLINPLPGGTNLVGYDLRPQLGSPALVPANASPALPSFFQTVPYVGAFSGPNDDWAIGWTNYLNN